MSKKCQPMIHVKPNTCIDIDAIKKKANSIGKPIFINEIVEYAIRDFKNKIAKWKVWK